MLQKTLDLYRFKISNAYFNRSNCYAQALKCINICIVMIHTTTLNSQHIFNIHRDQLMALADIRQQK